ncbi:MAG: RluA family pseudouridine synthase [Myxococcota bacterium]
MSRPQYSWVVNQEEPLRALLDRYGQAAALAEGRVFVEGKRAVELHALLETGARVDVYAPRETGASIEILSRQAGLVFVSKPVGIATEPERRGTQGTVLDRVAELLALPLERVNALTRLDVGVSGVVLVGLDAEARKRVNELRARDAFERRYIALASAAPNPASGAWTDPIGRVGSSSRRAIMANGERAETHYRVCGTTMGGQSLLALRPLTGRTHQLRVHAASHGAPLLGDATYGGPRRLVLPSGEVRALARIYLHAAWLQLGELERVRAPVPAEFESAWALLSGDPAALPRALTDAVLG